MNECEYEHINLPLLHSAWKNLLWLQTNNNKPITKTAYLRNCGQKSAEYCQFKVTYLDNFFHLNCLHSHCHHRSGMKEEYIAYGWHMWTDLKNIELKRRENWFQEKLCTKCFKLKFAEGTYIISMQCKRTRDSSRDDWIRPYVYYRLISD